MHAKSTKNKTELFYVTELTIFRIIVNNHQEKKILVQKYQSSNIFEKKKN